MSADYPFHGDESDTDIVDGYVARQRLAEELRHRERLAAIGRLAAGVAHEIGNPVTGIACIAQNLEHDCPHPDVKAAAEAILQQTRRITTILDSLLNFAHLGSAAAESRCQACPAHRCVDEAVTLLRLDAAATPVCFDNACDGSEAICGDYQKLLQALINLLDNARAASAAGARVTITTTVHDTTLDIAVTDDGPGIAPELQERIFEPFFTTKEPGQGTGLGLALVYSLTEEMQGTVSLQSPVAAGRGSRFTLHLPRVVTEHPG